MYFSPPPALTISFNTAPQRQPGAAQSTGGDIADVQVSLPYDFFFFLQSTTRMRVNTPPPKKKKIHWLLLSNVAIACIWNICTAPGSAISTLRCEHVHPSLVGVHPSLNPKVLNHQLSQQRGEKKTSASREITLQLFLAHLQFGNDFKKRHLWKMKWTETAHDRFVRLAVPSAAIQ